MTAGTIVNDLHHHLHGDYADLLIALVVNALYAWEAGHAPEPWVMWGEA